MIKVTEKAIIIDRKALAEWLKDEVPWEAGEPGYKTSDGKTKEFPTDHGSSPEPVSEPQTDATSTGEPLSPDGLDIFASDGDKKGGVLTNKQAKELSKWLKDNKFSTVNFARYLHSLTNLAGHPLTSPPINCKADGTPSIFQVASRWFTYWKASHQMIAKDYKAFVLTQLGELGYTVELALETFEGSVEVDPVTLEPKE